MKPAKHISPAEETALIKRAQAGDNTAFTRLVRQYEDLVYGFAFKVCRDKVKAEETWQDTFVNVYRKLNQFDAKSKFTTWLYSIVVNNCRMKRRKTKLEMASTHISETNDSSEYIQSAGTDESSLSVTAWRDTPFDKMMDAELKSKLDSAIQKLPYNYRVVFVLRDIEEQSAEETGRILKLSIPAVKSRLRRARIFLREQLNEYMTV